ncbi:beta-phosphoglucomutase [Ulvibacter antarcticus]|uniref:Beta-phosphoglucomutase n=1 Tax=Ulvibacter antarcticus TaxID=442714 RepID=A0A3L9YEM1_9FLAO|nr:beta-phosphoglucomutase [Ulvibacter antarcticus]RMA58834.1 beta-phosphoglucomutase [Ulvibacter antarcticus]
MHKKGFIFDLDGVIVDTAKYHFMAWKQLSKDLGISFSEAQNEQLKGVSRVKSLEKILAWGNKTISDEMFENLMAKKNEEYLSYIAKMDASEILPEVESVLVFLKEGNQKIALGSASKNARTILSKVKLLHYFEAIVDGTNVKNAKPDPEVFLLASEAIKINPEDCIVFEDSIAGIQAANTAGMLSIGIGNEKVLHEADFVFQNFSKMPNGFLMSLINNEPNQGQ